MSSSCTTYLPITEPELKDVCWDPSPITYVVLICDFLSTGWYNVRSLHNVPSNIYCFIFFVAFNSAICSYLTVAMHVCLQRNLNVTSGMRSLIKASEGSYIVALWRITKGIMRSLYSVQYFFTLLSNAYFYTFSSFPAYTTSRIHLSLLILNSISGLPAPSTKLPSALNTGRGTFLLLILSRTCPTI